MVNVVHALGWYFPESCGGTEVYVDSLVKHLLDKGIHSTVIAPSASEKAISYTHNNVPIYRYPNPESLSIEEIRGVSLHQGFSDFQRWLSKKSADVYHQHSWVTGCDINNLRYAKQKGIPTVATIHVPGNVCIRGTMMRNGVSPCDGIIEIQRCSQCWTQSREISSVISQVASKIPVAVGRWSEQQLPHSSLNTLVSTSHLVASHKESLLELSSLADRVVAVCQWLYNALLLNGVPKEKLVLCRQGVFSKSNCSPSSDVQQSNAPLPNAPLPNAPLHIGFLGRWATLKGIHILVKAVQSLSKTVPVKLTVYALDQGADKGRYRQQVMRIAESDTRIQFSDPVSRSDITETLKSFDLLAVPSQWLETGPLVVLEAQAAGVPVIGSDIGGIAELVSHGVDGWLVSATDTVAWRDAIEYIAKNRHLLAQWRHNIKPVRTMDTVAEEMIQLYEEVSS